jgi:hypothetical protein
VGDFALTDQPAPAREAVGWGASEFSIFFPANPDTVDQTLSDVTAVVEREKPAHTKATYIPVFPRFRIGVQAMLGVDSFVGGFSEMVLKTRSTLGYDSILGSSPDERNIQKLGTTVIPEIGVNATLL